MSPPARVKICQACLRYKIYEGPNSKSCAYCDPKVELTELEEGLNKGRLFARRFLIDKYLGGGGFGSVWKARDLKTECRPVAIKALKTAGTDVDSTAAAREIKALSKLNSTRVVTIYEGLAIWDDVPFFVMEYLEGPSLGTYLAKSVRQQNSLAGLQLQSAVTLWEQIIRAVADLHGSRPPLVHRDLKPENIVLVKEPLAEWNKGTDELAVKSDIQLKLIDFGTAKNLDVEKSSDKTVKSHTPRYAAPEQIPERRKQGRKHEYIFQEITEAADVFTLGLILLELLPEFDPNLLSLRWLNPQLLPKTLERLAERIPAKLAQLVGSCLATDPKDRPASAVDLLARLIELGNPASLPPPPTSLFGQKAKRARIVTATIGLGCIVSAIVSWKIWTVKRTPEGPEALVDPTVLTTKSHNFLHEALARSSDLPESDKVRLVEWAGRSRDSNLRPDLENLLADSSESVVIAAANALRELFAVQSKEVLRAAIRAKSRPDDRRRIALASALACLGGQADWKELQGSWQISDATGRAMALLPLLQCDPRPDRKQVKPLLDWAFKNAFTDKNAREALGIFASLNPEDPMAQAARTKLTEVLRSVGENQEGIEAIYQIAVHGDEDALTRLKAIASKQGELGTLAARRLAQLSYCDVADDLSRILTKGAQSANRLLWAIEGRAECSMTTAELGTLFGTRLEDRSIPMVSLASAAAILRVRSVDAQRGAGSGPVADEDILHAIEFSGDNAAPGSAQGLAQLLNTAQVLGYQCSSAARQHLLSLLDNRQPGVREEALRSLGQTLGDLCPKPDGATLDAVSSRLRQLVAQGNDRDILHANLLLSSLDKAMPSSLMDRCIQEKDIQFRLDCAAFAGPNTGILERLLSDPVDKVRAKAAFRLAELGNPGGISVLKSITAGGKAEGLVAYAALGYLKQAIEPPKDLEDQYPLATLPVRYRVVWSLGFPADTKAEWMLRVLRIAASRDPAEVVKRKVADLAAARYRQRKETAFLDLLLQLLNDPDAGVRVRAAYQLQEIRRGGNAIPNPVPFAAAATLPTDGGTGQSTPVASVTSVSPPPSVSIERKVYGLVDAPGLDLQKARQLLSEGNKSARTEADRAAVIYLEACIRDKEPGGAMLHIAAKRFAEYLGNKESFNHRIERKHAEEALQRLRSRIGVLYWWEENCTKQERFYPPLIFQNIGLPDGKPLAHSFAAGETLNKGPGAARCVVK